MSARSRTVKLFCPALAKLVPLVAVEEQSLDLGFIARTFGLEPATLKLNGHFISRGLDLISSSVTWKSLLSFFSARGLSTGANDADALIIDGKLCKAGTKRSHDPSGEQNDHQTNEHSGLCDKRKPPVEDDKLLEKKRRSGEHVDLVVKCNALGVKKEVMARECKSGQANKDGSDKLRFSRERT